MISLPERLNTPAQSTGLPSSADVQQRLPSLLGTPIALRPSRGPRPRPGEHPRGLRAGLRLGATGLESDVWLTSDGVAGARPRRRRARSAGASGRSGSCRATSCPSTSRRWPTCSSPAAPTTTCRSTSRGPASARPSSPWSATHAPGPAPAAVAVRPGRRRCSPRCGASTPTSSSSTRPALAQHAQGGPERRAANLAELGIDAINLHHTDWNGGLATLFHRFERVVLRLGHAVRAHVAPGAAHGHRRRVQRPRRHDGRRHRRRARVISGRTQGQPVVAVAGAGVPARRGTARRPAREARFLRRRRRRPCPRTGSGRRRSPRCGSSPR